MTECDHTYDRWIAKLESPFAGDNPILYVFWTCSKCCDEKFTFAEMIAGN